jgi:hypothetical protein
MKKCSLTLPTLEWQCNCHRGLSNRRSTLELASGGQRHDTWQFSSAFSRKDAAEITTLVVHYLKAILLVSLVTAQTLRDMQFVPQVSTPQTS